MESICFGVSEHLHLKRTKMTFVRLANDCWANWTATENVRSQNYNTLTIFTQIAISGRFFFALSSLKARIVFVASIFPRFARCSLAWCMCNLHQISVWTKITTLYVFRHNTFIYKWTESFGKTTYIYIYISLTYETEQTSKQNQKKICHLSHERKKKRGQKKHTSIDMWNVTLIR